MNTDGYLQAMTGASTVPFLMEAFEYFGNLMKKGTVTPDELQNAWRFANRFPRRPYLALMGQQLELPADVDQALVLMDLLCPDREGHIDLSTLSLQELPQSVSASVREQLAEALAGLRMTQIMQEEAPDIATSGIDREQLAVHLQATGKAWYLRQT